MYQFPRSSFILKLPKGYLRDSGLTCYLNNIYDPNSLTSHPLFGSIFESFVIEHCIQSFALNPIKLSVSYYRTRHQAEIDLILEGPFGLIPVEIKSGKVIKGNQLFSLETFIKTYNCPIGIVINNGDTVEQLSEKIYQVPLAYC